MTKQSDLKNAIDNFMRDQTAENMLKLLIAGTSATKQGSGLMWDQVAEVIQETESFAPCATEKIMCLNCGISITVPVREDLTYVEKLCNACSEEFENE